MTSHPMDIPTEVRKKMARLYEKDGLSVAALKERFGFGAALIRQVIREEGVAMREPGGRMLYSTGAP